MDPTAISLIGIGIQLVVGIVAGVWAVGKLSGQITSISTRIDGITNQRAEDRKWLESVDKTITG